MGDPICKHADRKVRARGLCNSCYTVAHTSGRLHIDRSNRHGLTKSPEYKAWDAMKYRCGNSRCRHYPLYGGRGITISPLWIHSFPRFLSDVGKRPTSKHSLDRIDNNGNYEPGNVRWAISKAQSRNKGNNRLVTWNGVTRVGAEWSDITGLYWNLIYARLKAGWTPEKALTTPPRAYRK